MTEQQPFELVQRYPHFELRRYPAYVVAEIRSTRPSTAPAMPPSGHLFNYISGSNTARRSWR